METLAFAAGLLALAIAAFVACIRVGILLGRRIDRSIEERHSEENQSE
jgi:hypothetical protein